MRFVAYVVAILLLAACGSSSAAARSSPSAQASPSATASASASPGASPSAPPSPAASPTPPIVGAYGVLYTQGTGDTYTVSIVGIDGKVDASATPSNPNTTPMTCGSVAGAVVGPPVSTSNTRVYFQDAQGNVSFLTPNGETGHATRVPIGATTRSSFAVSPDDQRIAVVQATYTATGATTVLYVEDLNGGTNHVKLFSETGGSSLWAFGWHGTSNLVVAKVAACTQGGGPFCCGPQELHVVDPGSGVRRFTVGGSGCIIAGTASAAGVMCENTSSFSQAIVLGWTGGSVRSYPIQGPQAAYLSPDGSVVALVEQNATTFAGAKQTLNLQACGWIDGTHVLAGGDTQQQALVGDVTSGNLIPVAAQGFCGGRIPGGL